MPKKRMDLINVFIILLFIILIVVLVTGKLKDDKEQQKVNALIATQTKNNPTVLAAENKQQTNKTKVKSVYDKLRNKENISTLVIGDAIAQGDSLPDNAKWHILLKSNLESTFNIKADIKLLTEPEANAFSSWSNYLTKETANKYDAIFLCLGEKDITSIELSQFQNIYESLIRKIKELNPECEVVLIIESSIQINKTVPDSIKAIGDYYGIPYIDMREAFKKSNLLYSKLSPNGILPSSEGSKIYGDTITEFIKTNVTNKKSILYNSKDSLYKTQVNYNACTLQSKFDTNVGFASNNGNFSSTAKGSSLSFSAQTTFVGTELQCGPDYGVLQIYLDGALAKELDCYYPTAIQKQILIDGNIPAGKHTIKFQTSATRNSKSTGFKIGIDSIYTN